MTVLDTIRRHRNLPDRPGQTALFDDLCAHISSVSTDAPALDRVFMAEAPPGTGKSLAYTAAAFASGRNLTIATATKSLQDQLFTRDIPQIREAVVAPVPLLLKGMTNYACLHKVNDKASTVPMWAQRLSGYFSLTPASDGDRVGINMAIPQSAWQDLTSTHDNCLGSACEYREQCFYMRKRASAMTSRLTVTNHAMLVYAPQIAAPGSVLVVDEAHKFAESVRDAQTAAITYNGAERASVSVYNVNRTQLLRAVAGLIKLGRESSTQYADESLLKDTEVLRNLLEEVRDSIPPLTAETQPTDFSAEAFRGLAYMRRLQARLTAGDFIVSFDKEKTQIKLIPKSVDSQITRIVEAWHSTIFVSATLDGADMIGMKKLKRYPSPFDHASKSVFVVPEGMPAPNAEGYDMAVRGILYKTAKALNGHTLALFTSHRALNEATKVARSQGFTVYSQADGQPLETLVEAFALVPDNAILMGTQSFWAGTDVPGSVLHAVVIDKLPFAQQNDPYTAYLGTLPNAFPRYAMPMMTRQLRQGVGRLIRRETDYGVVVICDPRILAPWCDSARKALPPMSGSRDLDGILSAMSSSGSP